MIVREAQPGRLRAVTLGLSEPLALGATGNRSTDGWRSSSVLELLSIYRALKCNAYLSSLKGRSGGGREEGGRERVWQVLGGVSPLDLGVEFRANCFVWDPFPSLSTAVHRGKATFRILR